MNVIRKKLDTFIRKYYTNKIVAGTLIMLGIFTFIVLLISIIEYFAWLNETGRGLLLWSAVGVCFLVFVFFILIPLLKLLRLGKIISYEESAKIIGKFFPEIKDKLLNYLELEKMGSNNDSENTDLIEAGINQKIEKLSPINFSKAVDFKSSLKWLKYVLPIVLIFIAIVIVRPAVIQQPTQRILNYNTTFIKPQPFYINLIDNKLEAIQNSDVNVMFSVTGKSKPENLYISFESSTGKTNNVFMQKINDTTYGYTFKNIQHSINFYAHADDIKSKSHTIEVFPKPAIVGFNIELDFPEYTNLESETVENAGSIKILYGTTGKWNFITKDADGIMLIGNGNVDTITNRKNKRSSTFSNNSTFTKNEEIAVVAYNKYLVNKDTIRFNVEIVNDLAPDITVSELRDSVANRDLYFNGTISDDYGFSSLNFHYRIMHDGYTDKVFVSQPIAIDKDMLIQQFYHQVNINDIGVLPGEGLEYYFEICDNNETKGANCTSTSMMSFQSMTLEEYDEQSEQISESVKDNLNASLDKMNKLNEEIDEFLKSLREKNEISFSDKEKLENLLQQEKELKETIEEQQQNLELNNFNENQLNEFSDRILEKQQKLQELYDKILDEDMKKMIEDIEKMLEDFNKDKLDSQLRNYQNENEDLEKQLDQTLEMYKNLEFEQQFEKTKNRLDSLAKKQSDLAQKTEDQFDKRDKENNEKLAEEQKQLNKEFEKLKEDLQKLEEMNNNLSEKMNIDFDNPKQEDVSEQMDAASEKLDKNQRNAHENQKEAAEKMQEMAQELQQQFDDSMYQQAEEDEGNVRRLLENVVHLSFKEEQLIEELKKVKTGNPKYVEIIYRQNEINTQLQMVEDTLTTIANRNFAIGSYIFDELGKLKQHVANTNSNLTNRNTREGAKNLQQSMTSLNVFALMLSESLDQMNEEMMNMASCPSGKKNSKNKGQSGSPSVKTMKDLQNQLKEQMEQMKKQMDQGNPSQGDGNNLLNSPKGKSMSEQFAKMAMQQEAIRRQLQALQEKLRSEGKAMGNELQQAVENMEKTENDLINKRLTNEMLKRQQEIMTRLLEAEKAERQREQDNKRESKEGKKTARKSPEEIFNIIKKDNFDDNELRTVPPNLNSYYRQKLDKYRYHIQNDDKNQ